MAEENRDLEAERSVLLDRLLFLVSEPLRVQIEQAVQATSSLPQIVIKVSHSGAFDANKE